LQERKEIVGRIYAKGERKQISNGKEGRRSQKVLHSAYRKEKCQKKVPTNKKVL
jgi:hypothetical protein